MPDVEVGLGAVVGDEDLAVLERVHGSRIHVQIGIQFLHHHAESARRQKIAQARGREAFAEGGNDAPGDEDVLGNDRSQINHHGVSAYPRIASSRRDTPLHPTR